MGSQLSVTKRSTETVCAYLYTRPPEVRQSLSCALFVRASHVLTEVIVRNKVSTSSTSQRVRCRLSDSMSCLGQEVSAIIDCPN